LNCYGLTKLTAGVLPLFSSAVVDVSDTAGSQADDVEGSPEAMPLISGITIGVPTETTDSLVSVVGSGISVTLLGIKSESINALRSDGNIPDIRKFDKILDGLTAR
jgi:hypothetical protein